MKLEYCELYNRFVKTNCYTDKQLDLIKKEIVKLAKSNKSSYTKSDINNIIWSVEIELRCNLMKLEQCELYNRYVQTNCYSDEQLDVIKDAIKNNLNIQDIADTNNSARDMKLLLSLLEIEERIHSDIDKGKLDSFHLGNKNYMNWQYNIPSDFKYNPDTGKIERDWGDSTLTNYKIKETKERAALERTALFEEEEAAEKDTRKSKSKKQK